MRYLKTLSVLSMLVSLAWPMTLETTSARYLTGNGSFKSTSELILDYFVYNYVSHVDDKISSSDINASTSEQRSSRKIKQGISKTRNSLKAGTKPAKKKVTDGSKKQHLYSSTSLPITIKLTKPTRTTTTTTTKKPTVSTKKSSTTTSKLVPSKVGSSLNSSNLKQDWYEPNVPYPNPMPDITSNSPSFPIAAAQPPTSTASTVLNEDIVSPEIISNSPYEPLQGVPPILPPVQDDLESVSVSAPAASASNPISTFNLDMLPADDLTRDPAGSGCPTVHISSSVLTPQQRQDCSDLSLVLNTHYHQNSQDTRNPGNAGTYASDPVVESVGPSAPLQDNLANAATAADPATNAVASPGGGVAGGSGGPGGLGGDGGGNWGNFKLPDLKPAFEAAGYLMQGLGWLLRKLMNPWLYVVPVVLFFALGFLGIILLFPWWIPFVFLYFSVRSDEPKNTVAHVDHIHKPVVVKHPDRFFWDQRTKTWRDVDKFGGKYRRNDDGEEDGEGEGEMLDEKIRAFGDKYTEEYSGNVFRRAVQRIHYGSVHLNDTNATMVNVLDSRTPPRIQNQIKEKLSSRYSSTEDSHAGVAIPVLNDVDLSEDHSTDKSNFYKLDRPTTTNTVAASPISSTASSASSTWVLLSGQSAPSTSTLKSITSSKKPAIIKDDKSNETLMLSEKPIKTIKPAFKPRSTTTRPTTIARTPSTSTKKPDKTKLTKIKASLLQNATRHHNATERPAETTTSASVTTTMMAPSANLPVEAKDGDQDLSATDEGAANKKKKTTQKRKKNKNKKRKPAKNSQAELKEVESPGTQLYSYLRSEIIPVTVGVSLVGLLVTAGLASYYLQPFAALRRSDPVVDRKDTEGGYYYQQDYSNAMPEEEAIGKVIAGMPDSALQSQSNNQPTAKTNYYSNGQRYRQVDRRSQIYMNPYGKVEDAKLESEEVVTPAVVPEHGPRNFKGDTGSRFVVGNVPKEYLSPGEAPRSLRIRKRRQAAILNDISPEENEIDVGDKIETTTTSLTAITTGGDVELTTEEPVKETTPHNVYNPNERPDTLFELIAELFKLKLRLGLELVQNVTNSVSSYVTQVRTKLDEHYRRTAKHS